MPIMRISNDDIINNSIEVMSLMSFPDNEVERLKLKCRYVIESYVTVCDDHTELEENGHSFFMHLYNTINESKILDGIRTDSEFFKYALEADKSKSIASEKKDREIVTVGLVLFFYYINSVNTNLDFGLKKSVFLTSKYTGITEGTIWKYWSANKSISHMCCAASALQFCISDSNISKYSSVRLRKGQRPEGVAGFDS